MNEDTAAAIAEELPRITRALEDLVDAVNMQSHVLMAMQGAGPPAVDRWSKTYPGGRWRPDPPVLPPSG